MKILVTGGTGLLGNNVVRQALARGEEVRVVIREGSDPRPLEGLQVERVVAELADAESLQRAAAGCDLVVHAAAYIHIGWRNFEIGRRVNVEGTRNVALAAREAGARLVHVSTVDTLPAAKAGQMMDESAAGPPKTACCYVVTKREAEQVIDELAADGLSAVIVHPGLMFGPWDWKPSSGQMLLAVTGGRQIAAPPGGASVCDVRDVAAGILSAGERGTPGRHYILSGENLSYFDLWSLFASLAGHKPPLFRMRAAGPFLAGWLGNAWGAVTGREPLLNTALVRMSRLFHYYSSQRAAEELGYHSRPAKESIGDAWRWLCDEGRRAAPASSR